MLLRSSYGTGFLAPSLYQLFTPNLSGVTATGTSDPIRCPVTPQTPARDCNTQFGVTFGGNPTLQPEKSEQVTLGMVFEPINGRFALGSTTSSIDLKNAITNGMPVATILGDLGQYGELVTRGPVDPALPEPAGPHHQHRADVHQPGQHAHRGHRRRAQLPDAGRRRGAASA